MAIIDPDGLFNGKRLRSCSARARLLWPYLYLLSNRFGRIEFDFDAIAFKFASFGDAAPTNSEISACFDEYERQHLILVYEADGQRWAQWDTRRTNLKKFKMAADKQSPPPPEPMYRDWLREQHRDDWPAYHCTEETGDDGLAQSGDAQASQDFRNTPARVNQELLNSVPSLAQNFGLGGGVGVGVGNGKRDGGGGGTCSPTPNFQIGALNEVPENATPPELVSGLLERLGIPSNVPIFRAVAESIRVKATSTGSSAVEAANAILLKAALAKKKNPPESWLFWFRDARYDQPSKQEAADEWVKRQSEDAR